MKKYITLIVFALGLATSAVHAAEAPAPVISDQRTVLSRTTDTDGITTSIYIGRISSDPGSDGEFPVTVHLSIVKTTPSGRIISDPDQRISTLSPVQFVLPKQAAAGIVALVKAAYDAREAAANPRSLEPAP